MAASAHSQLGTGITDSHGTDSKASESKNPRRLRQKGPLGSSDGEASGLRPLLSISKVPLEVRFCSNLLSSSTHPPESLDGLCSRFGPGKLPRGRQ